MPSSTCSVRSPERGRRLGETILNFPPPAGWKPGDRLYETAIELGPHHEVLVTTRPPLDDTSFGEKKQVLRGYTEIEWRVLQALRPYFAHLSRSQVRLAPNVAARLRPGFEHFENGVLFQRIGAYYKEFPVAPRPLRKPKRKATPVFLLRKPGGLGKTIVDGIPCGATRRPSRSRRRRTTT